MDRGGIVKLTEKIYFSGKYEGAPKVCLRGSEVLRIFSKNYNMVHSIDEWVCYEEDRWNAV